MRLWSLHPSFLDRAGLLAVWREGLLAQKVLLGKTKGYRFHPQLARFKKCAHPVVAIGSYLSAVLEEACSRGYHFDASKIVRSGNHRQIPVTKGQVAHERDHLASKLAKRAPHLLPQLRARGVKLHPLFRGIAGGVEPWEVLKRSQKTNHDLEEECKP
jgi:hypothetical protein